jgi:serine/threonine protein kinase
MNFEKMEKKVSSFPWNFNAPLRIDIEKIDEKFDNFRVILGKELGRGTYGVVHQVVKEGVPTGMVVKTMRRNELEHIIAEITTLLYCTGNCVPKFYAYDLIYSCGFFTCRILMSECTPVETLDASAVVMFLNALAEFHEQEFIHGDIKLANIMRSNGHLTLIDFGSSRKIPLMNYVPPTYSSGHEPPESIPYNSQISQKSDIWAFGITILTSFLSREEMFNGKMNIVRALMASSHDEYSYKCSSSIDKIISLIVELKEFVPSGFHRKIVDLCLVVDPGKRPTVKELLNISLE